MKEMGEQLGVDWAPPFTAHQTLQKRDGSSRTDRPEIAYSRQGPPHLEVIQGVEDPEAVCTIANGPGLHHFGIYVERWRREVDRLEQLGMTVEGIGNGMAYVRDPLGMRYEIISFKGKDVLLNILSGKAGHR